MLDNTITLRHHLLSDMLKECQMTQDLVIICRDGQLTCNAFLFSAVFRGFNRIIDSAAKEDSASVILPDISAKPLQEFLDKVYQQKQTIEYHPSIQFLLSYVEKEKSSHLKTDVMDSNFIKEETYEADDYEDAYDAYDEEYDNDISDHLEVKSKVEKFDDESSYSDFEEIVSKKRKRQVRKKKIKDDTDDYSETSNGNLLGKKRSYKVRKGKFKRPVLRFLYTDLTCRVCDKTLSGEYGLYLHVYNHHGPFPPQNCELCDKVFYSPLSLNVHHNREHLSKIPCPTCGKLVSPNNMTTHRRTHGDTDPFKCDKCPSTFKYKRSLDKHILTAHEDIKFLNADRGMEKRCDEECKCGIQFPSLKAKLEHYRLVHLGYQKCSECNRLTKEGLRHVCFSDKKPKRTHFCKFCGKQFAGSSGLHYHIHTEHTAEESSCDKCGKRFENKVSLKSHIRKQCNKEAEQCTLCGVQVKNMKAHIYAVHTRDEDKTHCCEFCGKGFMEKKALEKHKMNVHLKLRPHRCRYGCDIGYNDISNRNSHEKKIHGGLFAQRKTAVIS